MANYAVRIYDTDLRNWLMAEASRRGRGVRTSDVAEEAIRAARDRSVTDGPGSVTVSLAQLLREPGVVALSIISADETVVGRARLEGDTLVVDWAPSVTDVADVVLHHNGGSDATDVEVPLAPGDPVRGGDAPNRVAANADAAPRETVVQPVPAVDSGPRMVMPERILWPEHEFKEPPAAGTGGPIEPVLVYDEPVQRGKGPDSGPDEELGF